MKVIVEAFNYTLVTLLLEYISRVQPRFRLVTVHFNYSLVQQPATRCSQVSVMRLIQSQHILEFSGHFELKTFPMSVYPFLWCTPLHDIFLSRKASLLLREFHFLLSPCHVLLPRKATFLILNWFFVRIFIVSNEIFIYGAGVFFFIFAIPAIPLLDAVSSPVYCFNSFF